jgi:hypothetical protein
MELCYLQGFETFHFTEELGWENPKWVVRKGPAREKYILIFGLMTITN